MDWIKKFFGVERIGNQYGFSEVIGNAPLCEAGFFHFLPYSVPLLMDANGKSLPREGVNKGRLVLVDPIPTSYWAVSFPAMKSRCTGTRIAMWLGWAAAASTIRRFSESEGGDDKITCARITGGVQ